MSIISNNELLLKPIISESCPISRQASLWTVALGEYLVSVFPEYALRAKEYSTAKTFFSANKTILNFLKDIKLVCDSTVAFEFDGKIVRSKYIPGNEIPFEDWSEEVYYSSRCTKPVLGVPSVHTAILEKIAHSKLYLYSDIPRIYPQREFVSLCGSDVEHPIELINSVLEIEYIPITEDQMWVPTYIEHYRSQGAVEMYIPSEDRCALVPRELVDKLSASDYFDIKLHKGILSLSGTPLHRLINKFGLYSKGALNLIAVD